MDYFFANEVNKTAEQQYQFLLKEIDSQRLAKEVAEDVKKILEQQRLEKDKKKGK